MRLILQAAIAGALCSGVANAQQAPATSADKLNDELWTVIITGSLIKRTDTETPAPSRSSPPMI